MESILLDDDKSVLFEVVGNEIRRKILRLLVLEPHYVSQLSKILDKSQPAILKHMKILEDMGIVVRNVQQASESNKGPDRHFFSINKSFTIMYSLSPHNVRENVWNTDPTSESLDDSADESSIDGIKTKIDQEETIAKKVAIINGEIEQINNEMMEIEKQYITLERKRNNLLKITNSIIENSDDLQRKEMYEARQLLRKHVCESRTCVQEISNLLNKKEKEIEQALSILKENNYIEVNH